MNPYREYKLFATVERVQHLVKDYYENVQSLRDVYAILNDHGLKGYLFCGAIRDMVTSYPSLARPRDLDVVVTGPIADYHRMIAALPAELLATSQKAKKTREDVEGSGRENTTDFKMGNDQVELWHISRQRGMSEFSELDIANVPASTYLIIESIVASVGPGVPEVHDAGFCDTMNGGVLGCRSAWESHIIPEKAAIKALALAARLNMKMSPDLSKFVRKTVRGMTVGQVCDQLSARYGRVIDVPNLLTTVGADEVKFTFPSGSGARSGG